MDGWFLWFGLIPDWKCLCDRFRLLTGAGIKVFNEVCLFEIYTGADHFLVTFASTFWKCASTIDFSYRNFCHHIAQPTLLSGDNGHKPKPLKGSPSPVWYCVNPYSRPQWKRGLCPLLVHLFNSWSVTLIFVKAFKTSCWDLKWQGK